MVVKPRHEVLEQPKAEDSALLESRRWRRRLLGLLMRNSFVSLEDVGARVAVHLRAGVAFGGATCGHLLAPSRYRAAARLAQQGFSAGAAHRTHVHAQHGGVQGAVEGLLTGFAAEEKAECVASVLSPAGLKQRLRPHRGDSGARIDQPE